MPVYKFRISIHQSEYKSIEKITKRLEFFELERNDYIDEDPL
jgi:hypothetical protein